MAYLSYKMTNGQLLSPIIFATLPQFCLKIDLWSFSFLSVRIGYNTVMTSKIQQNKARKRSSLLGAAYELLTRRDLQDISVADITSQAGVAKGTFYLFFKDKYDLHDSLIARESFQILTRALAELDSNDIRNFQDAIIFMINHILKQLQENPLLLHLIKRNLSFGVFHKHLSSAADEEHIDLSTRFTELAERCGYHYEKPKIVYAMILELTGTLCYTSIVENEPAPIGEVKPMLFNAIRAILESAPQRKPEAAAPVQPAVQSAGSADYESPKPETLKA